MSPRAGAGFPALTFDPAAVDAVLFDMGGVFVLPTPSATLDPLADRYDLSGVGEAAFHRAHYQAIHGYDRDESDAWERYVVHYLGALGLEGAVLADAVNVLLAAWASPASERWNWVQPEAAAALGALARGGIAVGIVSNCDGTAEEILVRGGVCQVGDGPATSVACIVDSEVVGVAKPDPAVFRPALDVLGVAAHRTVYVGDSRRYDVGGAVAAGMHPVQLDPYGLGDGEHDRIASLAELVTHLLG